MSSRFSNLWRIAPCLFTIIVDYMGLGLVYPIITAMFTEVPDAVFPRIQTVEARDFFMGLAYVLYPLFTFFGASFLGDLSDNYGRKKVLLLSLAGIFVSFLIMSMGIRHHSISIFLIGRAFSGLMAGSQPLCMAAIADISTPETKASNLSLVTLTNCIGLIFGPFVGGVFTSQYFLKIYGYSIPFFIGCFMALIGFLLVAFIFKETYVVREKKLLNFFRPITIFKEAFETKRVLFLVVVLFLQMLGFMLAYQTSGVYLRENFHYSSSLLGYFYAFLGIFFAVGVLVVVPYVLKRWSLETIVASFFLLNGLAVLVSVWIPFQTWFWAMAIFYAIGNSTGFTAIATLFSNSTTPAKQGWIMGVCAASAALSFAVAGFSTNLLPLIGPSWVITIGGVLATASGLLMYIVAKEHKTYSR